MKKHALYISSGLLTLSLSFVSCSKQNTATVDSTSNTQPQSTANAVDAVAGDKEMLRQALILADSKGTLEAALTEAAQDSVLYVKMSQALANARTAKAVAPAPAKPVPGAQPKAGAKTSQNGKGDALDQASDAVNKADRAVSKSGDIINHANDVGKKADDILHGRR